jgi:c-di-GMP-binding flagellar brake protein YcgR
MKSSDIKLNMRLEIGLLIKDQIEYLPARVEGMDAETLALSMPMWRGALIPVHPKQRLAVRIFYHGSYYGFDTAVIRRILKPLPLMAVYRPQVIQAVGQRRRHVRVHAALPVKFRLLSDNNNNFSAYEAQTVDISAGGVLLSTEIPVKPGQELLVQLFLPSSEVITCKAKTVRVFNQTGSLGKGQVALQFEDISEKDRDQIARFVFAMQRELIKKGLLEA